MKQMDVVKNEVEFLLRTAAAEYGKSVEKKAEAIAAYTAQRAAHLALIGPGESGFAEALKAECQAVALFAGLQAVHSGDELDARLMGILQSALTFGARLLLTAV